MQRATTVWGTQGAVTCQRLGSQGVTIIDALTTGALQESRTFQHRAVFAAGVETPGGGPEDRLGTTTLSSTRTPLHERRHLGCVALAAAVAAEKVEDAQRRGGREEQPLRRFGLGRSMVVR